MAEVDLPAEGLDSLFGRRDENLKRIESALGVSLAARGGHVVIEGAEIAAGRAQRLLEELSAVLGRGYPLKPIDVETALRVLEADPEASLLEFFLEDELVQSTRRLVTPRSPRQQEYLKAMAEHDLVISIGPAGTGKTFLAVAMAAAALREKRIRRVVLARPAVEAGEKLGFLPGDLAEKVNPYLRPLYDALYDLIGFDKVHRLLDRGTIEVAPIAFMRGRTLNESFIILDEAQNTTPEQMKMFLTRIGFRSKAVINGDITQVDLDPGRTSGLIEARQVLRSVDEIKFIEFDQRDVVRHQLVQKVINAYERHDRQRESRVAVSPTEMGTP